uniref:Uncharacterized protein n=1 Tax=Branchiostoma floridae TaxID=7739 RepID=C3YFZ7_BRAFL|eukprot:XP_002604792.1 hypothetical protein BRAFLDRAFT_119478 [Branchiostoma floridae]
MGTSEIYVITCMVMTLLLHEAHAQQENLSSAVTRLDAQFRSMERRLRTQNVVRDNQNKKLLEQNRRQTEKLRLLTGQLDKVQAKVVDVTSALETSKLDASDARQKAVEMQTIVGRQEATIMDLNMRVQALEGAKIAYESTLSSLQRKLDSVEAVAVNRPTSGIDLGSDSDEDSLFDYDSIFVAQEPDSKKKKLGNKAIQKLLRNHTIEISRLMRRQSSASKSLGGLENDVKKNVLAISDLKLKDKALEGTLSRTTSQILEFSSQRTVFGATVSSIRSEVSSVRRRMDETANKVSNATTWIATMDTKTKRLGNSLSNLMSDYRRYFGSQSSGEKTIGEIVKDLKEEDGKLMEGIKANDVGLLDLENRMENMESRVGRNPWPIDTPNQNAASSEKITEMRRDLTRLEADLQRAQGEVRGAMTMLTAHVQETSYLPRKISNLDRLLQGYGIFINSFQDQTDEIKYTIKEQNQTIFEMQLAVNGLQDTFVSLFPESSGKSSRQQKQMDRMGDKLKEMGVNIERLTGRVSAVQQIAASVEPMKNQIQNISTFMTNLNGTAQKLELVTGRVTTLEDQGPEFQALKDKVFVIDKIAGSIPLVQRNVTTLQEEVALVDTFAQKMRNLERSMAVVGGKVAELNNVKKATNMLEERADNFDLGLQEISKVTKDMEALQERMFRVKSKVSEIDSLMTMVLIGANTTSNTIPGPDESTDEKDAAILELEGQIDVLRSALQKLTSQLENYTTESNQKMSEIERSIIFGVGGNSPINVGEGESTASPGAIMAFSGQLREAMEKVEMMVNAMQNQATSISDNTLKIRELGDLVQQFGTVSPGGNVIAELQTKLSILEQMLQPGNIPTLDSAGRSFDFAELEGMRQQLTGALATSSELTNRIQQLESLYQTSIASKPTESGGLSVDVEERFAKVENDSIAARKLIQTIRDSVEASMLEMQGQVAKLEAFSDTYSSLANSLQTVNEGETQADSQTFKVIATDLAGLKSNMAILQNTIRAYDPRILVVGQLEMAVAEIDDRLKQYISRQQSTSSTNLQELAQVQVRSEELQKTVDGLRAAVASFESRLQDVSSRPATGVSQPVDAFVEYHNEISELINNANQVNLTLSRHQAILKTLQTQYAANKVMINNVMGSIQQQPSQPIQPPQPAVELESIARLETALTNHDAALSDVRAEIANHDSQMIQLKSMFAQSHASVAQFESKTTELGNMISVNRCCYGVRNMLLRMRLLCVGKRTVSSRTQSTCRCRVARLMHVFILCTHALDTCQSRDYDTTELMNITLDSVDENNGTILPTIQKINKIGDQTRQLAQLRSDVTVLNNGLVRLNRDLVMMRSDMANKSGVVDQLTRLNITGAMQQIGTKILSLEATVNGHSGVLEALIDEAKSKFEEQGGDIDKLKTMDTNFDYRLNIQVQKIMSLENDRGAIENALKKHQEIIQRLDAASTNQNTVLSSLEEKMSSSGETGKLTENSIENELGGISSTLIGRLEKAVTNNSLVIVDIQKSLSLHDQSMVRLDTMVSVHHDILSRMSTTTSEFRTEIDALQTAVKDLEWLVEEGGTTILPTGDLEVDAVTESVNNNTRSLVQVRQSISGIIENLGKMEAVVEDLRQTTSSVEPSGSASPNQGGAEDTLTPERANELIANNPFVTQLANRLANQSLVIDDLQDIMQAQYKQIGELESEVGDRFAEMSSRVDAVSTDLDARIAAVATNLGGESENGGSFLQKPDEELADVKDAIDKLDGRTFALELTMRNHSGAISFLREDVDLLAYGSSGDGASPVTGVDAQLIQRLQETTRRQSAMLEGHSAAISEISVKMDDIARLQQHAMHPDTATSSQGSGSPDTANLLAVLLKHNNTLARMEVEMKVLADYLEGQSRESRPSVSGSSDPSGFTMLSRSVAQSRESRPSVSGSSDPSGFTMLSRSVAQVELDLRSQEETLQYLGADITRLRLDLEKVNTTARSRKMPTGSNQGVTDSEDIWEALAAIEDKNEQQEDIIQSHTSDISSLLATSRDLSSRLSGLSSTGGPESVPAGDLAEIVTDLDDLKPGPQLSGLTSTGGLESVPAGDLAEIVADLDDLKSKYSNMTATVRFVQQLSNKAGIAATEWNKKRQFFERLLDSHTSAILQLMDKTNAIDAQMSLHLSETKMQSSAGGRSSGGRSGERPGGSLCKEVTWNPVYCWLGLPYLVQALYGAREAPSRLACVGPATVGPLAPSSPDCVHAVAAPVTIFPVTETAVSFQDDSWINRPKPKRRKWGSTQVIGDKPKSQTALRAELLKGPPRSDEAVLQSSDHSLSGKDNPQVRTTSETVDADDVTTEKSSSVTDEKFARIETLLNHVLSRVSRTERENSNLRALVSSSVRENRELKLTVEKSQRQLRDMVSASMRKSRDIQRSNSELQRTNKRLITYLHTRWKPEEEDPGGGYRGNQTIGEDSFEVGQIPHKSLHSDHIVSQRREKRNAGGDDENVDVMVDDIISAHASRVKRQASWIITVANHTTWLQQVEALVRGNVIKVEAMQGDVSQLRQMNTEMQASLITYVSTVSDMGGDVENNRNRIHRLQDGMTKMGVAIRNLERRLYTGSQSAGQVVQGGDTSEVTARLTELEKSVKVLQIKSSQFSSVQISELQRKVSELGDAVTRMENQGSLSLISSGGINVDDTDEKMEAVPSKIISNSQYVEMYRRISGLEQTVNTLRASVGGGREPSGVREVISQLRNRLVNLERQVQAFAGRGGGGGGNFAPSSALDQALTRLERVEQSLTVLQGQVGSAGGGGDVAGLRQLRERVTDVENNINRIRSQVVSTGSQSISTSEITDLQLKVSALDETFRSYQPLLLKLADVDTRLRDLESSGTQGSSGPDVGTAIVSRIRTRIGRLEQGMFGRILSGYSQDPVSNKMKQEIDKNRGLIESYTTLDRTETMSQRLNELDGFYRQNRLRSRLSSIQTGAVNTTALRKLRLEVSALQGSVFRLLESANRMDDLEEKMDTMELTVLGAATQVTKTEVDQIRTTVGKLQEETLQWGDDWSEVQTKLADLELRLRTMKGTVDILETKSIRPPDPVPDKKLTEESARQLSSVTESLSTVQLKVGVT